MRTTKPGVIVSRVTGHVAAYGANGSSAVGVQWEEICVAPCTFQIESGFHELMISGKGPATTRRFNLRDDEEAYLLAKPGSSALLWGGATVASLGFTAAILGGVGVLVVDDAAWPIVSLLGGVGATGLGIGMVLKSRSDLFEEEPGTRTRLRTAVTYNGTF